MYVFFSHDVQFQIAHAVIFTLGSVLFAYFLPKMLQSDAPSMPQGSDRYIGEKRSVKKSGGDYKISLDGVEYLIESDEDITPGDTVEIIGHR